MSLLSVPASPPPVPAGYPSPAQDYFDGRIDLNDHLIQDITSTYVVRVSGDSMHGAGIGDGDELIVNRALDPKDGSVVIAVLEGAQDDIRPSSSPNFLSAADSLRTTITNDCSVATKTNPHPGCATLK